MGKADKALASAHILLGVHDSDGATNRAYYAMFDATITALAWAAPDNGQSPPEPHGGLISALGRQLVQAAHVPADLGGSLNRVHELRLTADYLAGPVPLEKAHQAIDEAATFIAAIRELLARPNS